MSVVNRFEELLEGCRRAFRNSGLLWLSGIGLGFIFVAYLLEGLAALGRPVEDGIVAGMIWIWGATLLIFGLVSYAAVVVVRDR